MGFAVSKGTVVLPPDANLPDGTEVRVEPLTAKPLSERLSDVIGIVEGKGCQVPFFSVIQLYPGPPIDSA
jgi:hypothetical protein